MPEFSFQTLHLQAWLPRLRAGDAAARDELLRACQVRLEALVRRMLHRNPAVRRWVESGDVFTNAALRLLRALETTDVAGTQEFFNLAAAVIRRELIDLARHLHGPMGVGANHHSVGDAGVGLDAVAPQDPEDLDRWAALHEAVQRLPPEEQEVFSLTFYNGWSQQQVSEVIGAHVRTVRRRMARAVELLGAALGGQLPSD